MELLTAEDLVKILHLKNTKTVYNWLYSGTMPRSLTVKISRNVFFIKEEVENWIKSKRCLDNV